MSSRTESMDNDQVMSPIKPGMACPAPLGETLVRKGLLSSAQLAKALEDEPKSLLW